MDGWVIGKTAVWMDRIKAKKMEEQIVIRCREWLD